MLLFFARSQPVTAMTEPSTVAVANEVLRHDAVDAGIDAHQFLRRPGLSTSDAVAARDISTLIASSLMIRGAGGARRPSPESARLVREPTW